MKGRKRHLLVDTEGLLLTVVVQPADEQAWIYLAMSRLMTVRLAA